MSLLNAQQISLVASDVEQARITLNHLQDELIDHVCCEVEKLMQDGMPFDEAYNIIKAQTGIQVLQQIQENTLMLTHKYYAIMKTTLKITGNISLAMLATGITMKVMHLPGADAALIAGFILLCILFFPAAVFLGYDNKESRHLFRRIALTLGGIALMGGVLFKVMYWPGASVLLLGGWAMMLGIFLPVLLFDQLGKASSSKEKRIYILGAFSIAVFQLATVFKIFSLPGAGALMLSGAFLMVSCFLPAYTFGVLKHKEKSVPTFIYLIILCVYAVTLTAFISMRPRTAASQHYADPIPQHAPYYVSDLSIHAQYSSL
jgi:hypothetical protein